MANVYCLKSIYVGCDDQVQEKAMLVKVLFGDRT